MYYRMSMDGRMWYIMLDVGGWKNILVDETESVAA